MGGGKAEFVLDRAAFAGSVADLKVVAGQL